LKDNVAKNHMTTVTNVNDEINHHATHPIFTRAIRRELITAGNKF